MFDEERAKQSTQPTNQDIVLFQEEFARKQQEYQSVFEVLPMVQKKKVVKKVKKIDENGQEVEVEVEVEEELDTMEQSQQVLELQRAQAEQKAKLHEHIAPTAVGEYPEREVEFDSSQTPDGDDDNITDDRDWEAHMIAEVDDFHLPPQIKHILQTEFVCTVVPKRFVWDTVKRSLAENGRILDLSSALALAATTINPLAVDNASLDLDSYYDAVLDHACDLRGEPKRHRNKDDVKPTLDPSQDINELIKQFDGSNGDVDPTATTPDQQQKQEENATQQQTTEEQSNKKTKYPKMQILPEIKQCLDLLVGYFALPFLHQTYDK
jgi:hypothetical protein